ncbi:unnamed protein product [Rotaria sp. Silwood1]|nr:unnamed protein product [Rotaria sp. Silwood1]CAF1595373.1 unnamed protein product [Rotaria sp. Silwood1]CAF3696463.1 unnamed protein product [Rotaria sp. Silwood1]CAF3718189.1 unnamed protein product [Rotaria sp. Silwood1]CAF4993251.1 unnamed protein product [Rotaria sp. Silwood1]
MRYLRKLLTVDVVTIPLLPVETILKVIQSANIPPEAWLDCLLTALSSDSNGDQNAISFDFTPVIVPTLTMTFNRTPSPQFKPTPSKHRSPAVNQNFDDSKPAMKDEPKPVAISKPPPFKPKSSNDSRRLASADPKAFEAKFCRQRQEAIDNMTYRTAVNSWTAKSLDEVVKLILQLSSGKIRR